MNVVTAELPPDLLRARADGSSVSKKYFIEYSEKPSKICQEMGGE